MTNEQLVLRIQAGEDVAGNMERLYGQVKHFIHGIAWRYRNSGEMEDLEQEGYLALYPAIDGYNAASGIKFLTYAEYWIRQRMQRYLQMNGRCLRLPVHCLEKVQQYKKFCNAFLLEYGREPTEGESAAHLGLTLEQIGDIKKNACMARIDSLNAPVKGSEGGADAEAGDFIASALDLEGDTLERMQQERLQDVLWDCVDSLPGDPPMVIRLRYQEGLTLSQIGRCQGVAPEAVRQIHAKALRELRNAKNSRKLRPFLPEADQIYSMGIAGNSVGRFERTWTSSTERAALHTLEWEERRREERQELLEKVRENVRRRTELPA